MTQSRKDSLRESITNVVVGYLVALLSQIAFFNIIGLSVKLTDNLVLGVWFTVISLVRSYALRRYFNSKHNKC